MPKPISPKPSRFQLYVKNLVRKQNEAMFNSFKRRHPSTLRSVITLPKILAYLDATIFHLVGIMLTAAGLYYLIRLHDQVCLITIAFFGVWMLWLTRPRFGKFPTKYLTRRDVPTLYRLTDAIGKSFWIQKLDAIMFTEGFNAGFARVGLRQRSVLVLGTPLWNTLSGQEKVALLAHELAHDAKGDNIRSLYVGSVCRALITWSFILFPTFNFVDKSFQNRANLKTVLPYLLSKPFLYSAKLLDYLLSWEARRSEYLADYLASTVAGTDATRALLGKLYFAQIRHEWLSVPWRRYAKTDIGRFYEQVRNTPLSELERIDEIDPDELERLDLSHPPIGYRMKMLNAHFAEEPRLNLSEAAEKRMTDEIDTALNKTRRIRYDEDEFWQSPKRTKKAQ